MNYYESTLSDLVMFSVLDIIYYYYYYYYYKYYYQIWSQLSPKTLRFLDENCRSRKKNDGNLVHPT